MTIHKYANILRNILYNLNRKLHKQADNKCFIAIDIISLLLFILFLSVLLKLHRYFIQNGSLLFVIEFRIEISFFFVVKRFTIKIKSRFFISLRELAFVIYSEHFQHSLRFSSLCMYRLTVIHKAYGAEIRLVKSSKSPCRLH